LAAGLTVSLTGCVSVGSVDGAPAQTLHLLHDTSAEPLRRDTPLVAALQIQTLQADALADTAAIAYSRRAHEFAFYQLASWTERPVRQLPRLLLQRLEARGVAGAVGLLGDPLRADWLLVLAVDAVYHDVSTLPGVARFALSAELFDRRDRTRLARRQFALGLPTDRADSAAAALALSQAVSASFDELLPWLEDALQRALLDRP
jgi:cholesterol transport system auxiliary component